MFLTDKDIATAVPRHLYSTLKPEQTSCLIPVPHCRRDVVSLFLLKMRQGHMVEKNGKDDGSSTKYG